MPRVILRFYEELNYYLPKHLQKRDFEFEFKEEATILDILESLSVPPEEVDLILAEGQSVCFDYEARAGKRISIYPVFESINIAELTCLPHRPLRSTKFVLDPDLEDLAAYMKRVGHDVRFDSRSSWSEIVTISRQERRIILTSNPALLKAKEVTHAILLPSTEPEVQLQKIMDRLEISPRETRLSS
jgi:hypothetical protein